MLTKADLAAGQRRYAEVLRRLTPIERLEKSRMSVERLRAEMTRPTWENTLADAKAGDDIALLKVGAATELFNQGHPAWSPTAKKIVYATNTQKRADAQEKTMSSIFRGSAFDIRKSEDLQEFDINGKRVATDPVATAIAEANGKPTEATKRPFPPVDSFLEPNPDEALTPVIPGGGVMVSGAGTMPRDLNLLTPNEDETDGGAMFKPTTPGAIRMGDAYVGNFREPNSLEAVFKRRGALFTDLLLGPEEK